MMKQPTQQGINVVLYIGDRPLGGQQSAVLNRSMVPIDITNKIAAEWKENLAGIKSWNIVCNGIYVVDETALKDLDDAFINNLEIEVKLTLDDVDYKGNALIIDFPLNAIYNSSFKYSVKLLGTGELTRV